MAPSNLLSASLIVVTIISYIPQYQRLLTVGSSAGLSVASVFTMTLVAQVQVATMYYLFKSAPDMRYGIPISTPPSARDWLNLSQILVQWICSLFLFALVIYLPTSTTRPASSSFKKVAVSLLILHVLLFILSIPVGGRTQDIVFNIIRNINARVINTLFTLMTVVAFFFQARVAVPSATEPNALSNWTLGLQFFTFLLLAISWPFRLILPPNMWELGAKPALLLEWYPWVGWACVNNAIFAIGQGMILLLYSGDGKIRFTDERRPLLNPEE